MYREAQQITSDKVEDVPIDKKRLVLMRTVVGIVNDLHGKLVHIFRRLAHCFQVNLKWSTQNESAIKISLFSLYLITRNFQYFKF